MSNPNGPYRCVGCGSIIVWNPEMQRYELPGLDGYEAVKCGLHIWGHDPDGRGIVDIESRADVEDQKLIDKYDYPDESERNANLSEVIDRRVQVYGEPVDGFIRIAQVWSGILGHEVLPAQVPLLMIGMKSVRASVTPDYSDNSDDIEGYLDIFRKIVGEDMIHARSVEEYINERWPEIIVNLESE